MEQYIELREKIRDILDRNNFVNQKIDLETFQKMNKNIKVQDAFRIRVLQPLRFSVEIVKPIPLKDFLIIAGRLNIAPDHLKIIANLTTNQKLDLFEELRLELTKRDSNFKFAEDQKTKQIVGIECMLPIYLMENDSMLAKELFAGMDSINKNFFLVIAILQKFLRNAGYNPKSSPADQNSANSMYS